MRKKIILILVAVAVAGVGFWGGMAYEKSNSNQFSKQGNFPLGQNKEGADVSRNFNNQPISGEIISVDQNGITLKLKDGGSKIIFISSSTKIAESVEKNSNNLLIGTQAVIIGSSNSDGTITASSIQIGEK
jgi:hypothetical protein